MRTQKKDKLKKIESESEKAQEEWENILESIYLTQGWYSEYTNDTNRKSWGQPDSKTDMKTWTGILMKEQIQMANKQTLHQLY